MRLNRFDLNLLVALQALLEEHNVTRAAQRLNMTQPAMSAALRRLRESLSDQILVPHGRKMVPTSHAQRMAPLVAKALADMRSLLSESTVFDPATSRRVFHIAASDYITVVLIAPLLTELESSAPGIRIEVLPPDSQSLPQLERGVLDFMLTPEQFLAADHPKHLLFKERHVVVGWKRNPIFRRRLTEQLFYAAGHVAVELSGRPAFAEDFLRRRGVDRKIEILTSSFTLVPFMLPGTHRIAVMHERLARFMMGKLPLAIAPVPFELPLMSEMIQHHRARSSDGGLGWLLQQLLAAAASRATGGADRRIGG